MNNHADTVDKTDAYCIIGGGSSGICAGKHLKAIGIPFDIIEREDDVGGNWYYGKPNSSVYQSTHLISSKRMTEYNDFPMPDDYPDYPDHRQVLAYLRDYARRFKLYDHMMFNISVEHVARNADKTWTIRLSNGVTRRYRGLVIANGHLWNPKFPDYPGEFDGQVVHSGNYKTPDILRDKRVLVVGAGNSGCDIAVESAQHAAATFHSTRRGYYYVPKYAFGKPTDVVNEIGLRLRSPLWLRRIINGMILRILVGDLRRYGLRKPGHRLLETHPIVNQLITFYMGHGRIKPKVDVAELCGDAVRFADGSVEQIDVIVYATGFKISFPFIDNKTLNWKSTHPDLYINAFHREYDNLFVMGMIQPDSGQFWIVDLQAELMAKFIRACDQVAPVADKFRRLKSTQRPDLGGGVKYLDSTRHLLEIEHASYRRRIKKHIKLIDRGLA